MQDVLSIPSVTGVDLNLRIAGPGARSYAFIIDWHIRLLAALGWFAAGTLVLFGEFSAGPVAADRAYAFGVVAPALAIYFLYHPVVEVIMAGRSPGKRIAGVRVVRNDGAIPSVGAILIRNIFRLIDSLPAVYCVGLAVTILSERSLRVGDFAAGTLLVYDEPQAGTLADLSGDMLGAIGLEEIELITELLGRWDTLAPDQRDAMAVKLLRKFDALPDENADDAPVSMPLLKQALQDLLRELAASRNDGNQG